MQSPGQSPTTHQGGVAIDANALPTLPSGNGLGLAWAADLVSPAKRKTATAAPRAMFVRRRQLPSFEIPPLDMQQLTLPGVIPSSSARAALLLANPAVAESTTPLDIGLSFS